MASMGLFSFFNGYQSIANGCPGSQGLLNPPAVLTAPRVQPAAAAAPPPADQDMAAPYPPLAMAAAAGEPAAIDTSADGSADAEAFQLLPHPMDAAVGMHERPLEPLELQLDIHASLQLRELKQAAPPGPETFEHFARAREACINEMAGLTAAYKLDSAVFFTALAYFDNLFERAIHEHRGWLLHSPAKGWQNTMDWVLTSFIVCVKKKKIHRAASAGVGMLHRGGQDGGAGAVHSAVIHPHQARWRVWPVLQTSARRHGRGDLCPQLAQLEQ